MIKEKLIKEIKKFVQGVNVEGIDTYTEEIIEKVSNVTEKEVEEKMANEKIIDTDGEFNSYMLERFILGGLKTTNRRLDYENENGEGANPFEMKNGLVMLERTVKGEPIEMHIVTQLPEDVIGDGKTLRGSGMANIKLAFCDAILKIRKQWKEDETSLDGADELKVVSFMINGRTAEFLKDIGFDAESVRLDRTDFKKAPTIRKGNLEDKRYEYIRKELEPYMYKYAVHRNSQREIVPTLNLGFATISKEKLMSEEAVKLILTKREEVLEYLRNHDIEAKKEYGFVDVEKFETEYGFKAEDYLNEEEKENKRDVKKEVSEHAISIQRDSKKIAIQQGVPDLKEEAQSDVDALCEERNLKKEESTLGEN